MKPTVVSAVVLFQDFKAKLAWKWVAGLTASERRFDEVRSGKLALVLIWWAI